MTITTPTERITPKKATQMLNANGTNRPMRPGVAEQYASDMREGRWTQCCDPIVIYENGDIASGQHRLWAVVESDTVQDFIVVRNLDRASGMNLDTGLKRSAIDGLRISGEDPTVTSTMLAAARAIAEGTAQKGRLSNAARLTYLRRFHEAAEWVNSKAPRARYVGSNALHGAIGRAYLHELDKDRLARFCTLMRTGFMDVESDSAAIALRNYLLAKQGEAATTANWRDTFLKSQHSIWLFMRGRAQHVVKGIKDEDYPLVTATYKPLKGLRQQRGNGSAEQYATGP